MATQETRQLRGALPEDGDPFIEGGYEGLPCADPASFSHRARETREQIDPETGEPVTLLTKKQFQELLKKELREF